VASNNHSSSDTINPSIGLIGIALDRRIGKMPSKRRTGLALMPIVKQRLLGMDTNRQASRLKSD
jgi:hypothetical protein